MYGPYNTLRERCNKLHFCEPPVQLWEGGVWLKDPDVHFLILVNRKCLISQQFGVKNQI